MSFHHRRISKLVRMTAGCPGSPYPIYFEDGFAEPYVTGESYGYVTRGGRKIWHPSAYKKRGWSNMVYSPSTLAITVGKGWVLQTMLEEEERVKKKREEVKKTFKELMGGKHPRTVKFDSEGKIVGSVN